MATGSLNEKKGYYEDKRMVARSDGLKTRHKIITFPPSKQGIN